MRLFGFSNGESPFQRISLWIGTGIALVSLGLLAYLGTFTRFLADDYCDTMRVTTGSLIEQLISRYTTTSDRYSNMLFYALSEFVFPHNVQILPVVMIVLWTAALIWLVWEVRRLAGLHWPFAVDVFLGCLLAFFPILEAPNRFQTIYWRSGMATHFAPLVYLVAFSALLLLLIRRADGRAPAIWLGVLCFVLAFFGGGFSEPPDAMLVAAALLSLVAVWIWEKGPRRIPAVYLLSWTLGGGLLALAVMRFSPANSFRMVLPAPGAGLLLYRTALYPLLFVRDSLASLPLPTAAAVAISAVTFYGLFACEPAFTREQRWRLGMLMALAPVLMYGMIAASFAPSIYGQGYPVERARFAGCLMMTTAALVEGACMGTLAAQWPVLRSQGLLVNLASALLLVVAFYPLRAAGNVLQENLPYSRKWASAWDVRQAKIFSDKAKGIQDVVVRQLPGFGDVKELDTRSRFWVNRCAATFYGVQSISAPQMEYLH